MFYDIHEKLGNKLENTRLDMTKKGKTPGLYFSGELLDVDGVTGGFNFQHCWSSGWLAGKAIANSFHHL